jgi:hypothetical protein
MAKALKPLIIVLFILSIVSAVLGGLLFGKREILKDSVKKMVTGYIAVARNIEYKQLNPTNLEDYDLIDSELNGIKQAAKNKQGDLVETKGNLEETEKELGNTEDELEVTRTELQETEDQVVELQNDVSQQSNELADKEGTISDLKEEKSGLLGQVGDLESDLAARVDELNDWKADYADLKEDFDNLVIDVDSAVGDGSTTPVDIMDVRGRILVVDSDWNFVIIDKGRNEELQPNVVFIVHRDQEPVGKIRVRKVQDNLSIAEISHTWDGQSFTAGDEYIPPRSSATL